MSDTITDWIDSARSLTQSSSVPLGVPVSRHTDLLLRDTRRELLTALDALEAVIKMHEPGAMTCYSPSHTNPDAQCPECRVECTECGEVFPCPSVTTITTTLEADQR